MAESVDALVSNTSGFTSIPVRPRVWVLKRRKLKNSLRFSFLLPVTRWFVGINVKCLRDKVNPRPKVEDLLDGVGSLFGSSKTKQQQQRIAILEAENRNLVNDIKNLNSKIKTMETEHKTAIDRLSEQLNKIFNFFPHIKELMNFESFCRKVGFGMEMMQRLFNHESVGFKGETYSHEYQRKFSTPHSVAKIEPDPKQPQKFRLNIDGIEICDWFRQKQKEFLHSIGVKPQERQEKKGLKI